jgi:hopanoid biosynthesis associated protein HpnK
MVRAGVRFFFSPAGRRELGASIRAQFDAFRATGLALDHVNGHKHIHLHPTVARLMLDIGAEYGMRAVRVPFEPVAALRQAAPTGRFSAPFYGFWIEALRRRLQRRGMLVNDQLFGLAWSGGMVEERVLALLPVLPNGVSELYFHPATRRTAALVAAMPDYRHAEEFAALTSPAVKARITDLGIQLVGYGDLVR